MTPTSSAAISETNFSKAEVLRRSRAKRQAGSTMLYTMISLFTILTMMMFHVSTGQGFLAHNQLQISADAVARGALGFSRGGFPEFFSRVLARRIPRQITALERGLVIPDSSIEFGDWNYETKVFRLGGKEFAPAVRSEVEFGPNSPSGPIDLIFAGFLPTQSMALSARAIAAAGCREFVFAVDVSSGMEDEIDRALQLVDGFVQALDRQAIPGDKVGVAVYAGDAMSADEYAIDGGTFWGGPLPAPLISIPGRRNDVDDWLSALQFESNVHCADRRGTMPTRGRGSCLGKGDQHGIERAVEMFDQSADSCSGPGSRIIVLITSDTPCLYFGGFVGDPFNFYGGTLDQAYAAADNAFAAGVTIAPVLIDLGTAGNCPFTGAQSFQHADTPQVYIDKMARGFVTAGLVDPTQGDINSFIAQLGRNISVRIVD